MSYPWSAGEILTAADLNAAIGDLATATPDTIGTYTPVFGATTNPNLGSNGIALGRYVRSGRLITLEFFFEFGGAGITQGSGTYFVTPPNSIASPLGSGPHLGGRIVVVDAGTGVREFTPVRVTATAISLAPCNTASYATSVNVTSSTIGLTFAAGDRVSGVVQYFI